MKAKRVWLIGLIGGALALSVAAATQPNIILITTDDWGIGKVPIYKLDSKSVGIIKMPNLDRMRAEGMLFTDAYAGNAVCGPSRCSLLTGRHPGHAVWRANRKKPSVKPWPPNDPMLPEVARRAGYATAGFGKVSGGGGDTPENITAYGFDYWLGFLGHIDCRDYYSSYIYENGKKIDVPANTPEVLKGTVLSEKGSGVVEGGTFLEDLYAEKAMEFITQNAQKDQPFFIYYASVVPHAGAPGGLRTPSLEGYDKLGTLTRPEQVYCALMTRHDRNVGRILEHVKTLGIENNTIVIWSSDNGDESVHYGNTKTFDGNGPFRGKKRHLHEGGIRIPLIVWWPGTIPPGSVSNLQTAQWDWLPTIADAGGLPYTEAMDGISIMPTLRGEPEKQIKHDHLYFEFYERGRQQSVRMGNWKAYRQNGPGNHVFLYNLENDIAEKEDLAAQYPEIVSRMETIMLQEHEDNPVWGFKKGAGKSKQKAKGKKGKGKSAKEK